MATIKGWERAIKGLSPEDAKRKAEALVELGTWKYFRKEFEHEGLAVLYLILSERAKEAK